LRRYLKNLTAEKPFDQVSGGVQIFIQRTLHEVIGAAGDDGLEHLKRDLPLSHSELT
jgi:hypothetical protein